MPIVTTIVRWYSSSSGVVFYRRRSHPVGGASTFTVRDEAGFLLCAACGDRIGVYEPAVWIDPEGAPRLPSRTQTRPSRTRPLHRSCYQELEA